MRQATKDGDSETVESLRKTIDKLVVEFVEPYEKSAWREYAESIGIAVLLALFLRGFVFEAFKIPTGSMIPTLLVGDHLFVNKFIYGIRVPFTKKWLTNFEEPQKGEVLVFTFPKDDARKHLQNQSAQKRACIDQASLNEEKDMIKRVIGTEGDRIEIKNQQLTINGEPVKRTFLRKEATNKYMNPYQYLERETMPDGTEYVVRFHDTSRDDFGPIVVKPGHIFVMGDNRDNSSDGRCWGQVPVENIKGRAMIIWWSMGEDGVRWERFGDLIK